MGRNEPNRIKSPNELRLVSETEPAKRVFRIAISENIFSPRQKTNRKFQDRIHTGEGDILPEDVVIDPDNSSLETPVILAFAVVGFTLGYLLGKLRK